MMMKIKIREHRVHVALPTGKRSLPSSFDVHKRAQVRVRNLILEFSFCLLFYTCLWTITLTLCFLVLHIIKWRQ
jgi:hypothetical protein